MQEQEEIKSIQERSKEDSDVMPMVWVLLRALIPMKIAVVYFGSRLSEDPSNLNLILFLGVIAISFGSIIWYAIKKYNTNQ